MKTIESKLENSQKWKKAQKDLANFEEMMKLIRTYPTKPMQSPSPSSPYSIPEPPDIELILNLPCSSYQFS